MKTHGRVLRLKKFAAISTTGVAFAFPLGACDLGDFTTTTTTTLDGREVVRYLVRTAIITPIDNFLTDAIDAFFDEITDEAE